MTEMEESKLSRLSVGLCEMTPGYEQKHMLSKCGAPDGPVYLRISIQDMSVLFFV